MKYRIINKKNFQVIVHNNLLHYEIFAYNSYKQALFPLIFFVCVKSRLNIDQITIY